MSMFRKVVETVVPKRIWEPICRFWWRKNLCVLASLYGTDKWGVHRYPQHYQSHFSPLRRRRINLLEIGVGGYDAPHEGGNSLRMWKAYFSRANIFAIDLFDKSALQEPRIQIFRGSQADPDFLRSVVKQIGRIDVVIDDGSHQNDHVISSFQTLFPLLPDGAIYAIEDLQTAYWEKYGGSSDLNAQSTSMAMLRGMVDGLNWEEIPDRKFGEFDREITSLHFYHNLAFIYKGRNEEGTHRDILM